MGVDYSANFGFGVKVEIDIPEAWLIDNEYDPEDSGGLEDEYLDDILRGSDYHYFESGSRGYGGDAEFYIIDPSVEQMLSGGSYNEVKLQVRADNLVSFVSDLGMRPVGNPSIVGGLHIW